MTTITGVVRDVNKQPDQTKWFFETDEVRQSGDEPGTVVSTTTHIATPNFEGILTVELDPGPVTVRYKNLLVRAFVPDVPTFPLWALIGPAINLPPATPHEKIAAAVEAWMLAHPPEPTDLTVSRSATSVTVASSNGVDAVVPAADGVNAGVMTAAMQAKLAGIATSATANATDAALRDRSTHTGAQTSASISDFTEAVQDAVAALLAAGTNVTLNYNDAANTLTVTAAGGGGGGLDAEAVRDTIGVALLGTGNITVTANDALDTITITTTATVNATDAALRDRSTHTGSQSADSIVDGSTNKAFTSALKTKLDGIATNADVTGAANVAAAGAQMTSAKNQANGYAGLDSGGKVSYAQLPSSVMSYLGVWNASTNVPSLANGSGDAGDLYRVGTGGTRNLGSGNIVFDVGDYVIYNGSTWEKSDTTDSVASVAGKVGVVTLDKNDVGLGSVDNTADNVKAVASAAKLTTARQINGVNFDGTANITIVDVTKQPLVEAMNVVATAGAGQTIPDPVTLSMSRLTLTAATCALVFPTPAAGKSFSLALVQDATGGRLVTWPATARWAGGIAPTLTTAASKVDRFTFLCDDGATWAGFVAGLNFA